MRTVSFALFPLPGANLLPTRSAWDAGITILNGIRFGADHVYDHESKRLNIFAKDLAESV